MKKRRKAPKAVRPPKTREELERGFGQVWNTAELAAQFVITAIIDDQVVVRRKADNKVGTLHYQNEPRLYFGFEASPGTEGDQ